MRAVICEDSERALRIIHKYLTQGMKTLEMDCEFRIFSSPQELLKTITDGEKYDLFFLDIEMPGLNGIDLSRKIRDYLPDSIIIFISNKEELVFRTFEVRPFRFIRKNHFEEELPSVLKAVRKEFFQQKGPVISVTEAGTGSIIPLIPDDILYIEAMRKECIIHRKTDALIIKYKFSDFTEKLAPHHFSQAHRSYLVNCSHIERIDNDCVILDNQESVPLGRKHRDTLKKDFNRYAASL